MKNQKLEIEVVPFFEALCQARGTVETLQATLDDLEHDPDTLKSLSPELKNDLIAVARRQLEIKLSQSVLAQS